MILKTPFGYIDLFGTWEGWTLIGVVVLLIALLWWMEFGKVKCKKCKVTAIPGHIYAITHWEKCPVCHGSGRVRRGWISRLWRRK
jgi:hypothetical protein